MKALILGGTGYIGSNVVKQRPDWNWTVADSKTINLINSHSSSLLADDYDIIINAAGYYGGIVFNKIYQEEILYKNVAIANNVNKLVNQLKPRKFIQLGSACIYPGDIDGLISESLIGTGKFHPSIMFSSIAKYYQLKSLENLDVDWEYLVLTNVYGPGEPLEYEKSHFVGALIDKIKKSSDTIDMLGTGTAIRDFLFIDDAAEAVCRFAELERAMCTPINISSGTGSSIKEVTHKLLEIINSSKKLRWGSASDNGIEYKVLDNSKMISTINYTPNTTLEIGLQKTWKFFN